MKEPNNPTINRALNEKDNLINTSPATADANRIVKTLSQSFETDSTLFADQKSGSAYSNSFDCWGSKGGKFLMDMMDKEHLPPGLPNQIFAPRRRGSVRIT